MERAEQVFGVWLEKIKWRGLSSHQASSQCLYLWHFWILEEKNTNKDMEKKGHFLYPITIMGNLCSDVTSTEKSGDFLIMRRKQTRHDYINVLSGLWTHCRGSFYFSKQTNRAVLPLWNFSLSLILIHSDVWNLHNMKGLLQLSGSTDICKYIFGEGSLNSLVMYSNALICPPVQQSQLRT